MSETTSAVVRYGPETTWGTPDATAFQQYFCKDITYKENPKLEEPDGLTGNAMSLPATELSNDGSINLPGLLQFTNSDPFWASFLRSTFSAAITITASTIAFVSGTKKITDSGNGLGAIQIGDLVFVSGSASNNGWKGFVTAAAAGEITVNCPVTTESAGASVTIKYKRCRNGSTRISHSVEYELTDLSGSIYGGSGNRVTEVAMDAVDSQYVSFDVTMMGKAPSRLGATLGTGSPVAMPNASTFPFFNALGNLVSIFVDGVDSPMIIPSWKLKGTNNGEFIRGVRGTPNPKGVGLGKQVVTLDFEAYLDDAALAFEALARQRVTKQVWWPLVDGQGNSFAFALPQAQLLTFETDIGGNNKRAMSKGQIRATWDRTLNYQMGVYTHAVA